MPAAVPEGLDPFPVGAKRRRVIAAAGALNITTAVAREFAPGIFVNYQELLTFNSIQPQPNQ